MLNVPDTLSSASATGNPRNKTFLKRGRSLMDWVRLSNSSDNLVSSGGKLRKITLEEVAKHNTKDDAWIILKGHVYDVTPYLEFHPGGEEELMRGAGIDATALFNEVHKWVNFQSMLKKCLLGIVADRKPSIFKPLLSSRMREKSPAVTLSSEARDKSSMLINQDNISESKNFFSIPTFNCLKSPKLETRNGLNLMDQLPTYDWFQTRTFLDIAIYTKWKDLQKCHVFVINEKKSFKSKIYIKDQVYTMHLKLQSPVHPRVRVNVSGGKVDILLDKIVTDVRWTSIGEPLDEHNNMVKKIDIIEPDFLTFEIVEKTQITHNTYCFTLNVPENIHFITPVGYHVFLKPIDTDICKPYTPVITDWSIPSEKEVLQIFFKVYRDGSLTPLLEKLSIGDEIECSLPDGTFSNAHLNAATEKASNLLLLAAGTGITPHLRIMVRALENKINTTLLAFNQTEEDIPWKKELKNLAQEHCDYFKVIHVLSRPGVKWNGLEGRIRKEILEENLPEDKSQVFICVCGTTGFTSATLKLFEEMNYSSDQIFAFTG